jgi:hypothetical protein
MDYILVCKDEYCKKCDEKYNNIYKWCKPCLISHLKNNFTNWTSENKEIDNFIQEMQLKINEFYNIVFEWIPYNQFIGIKKMGKDDESTDTTMYSAIWKNGPLIYDNDKKIYERKRYRKVAIKCLNNSQNKIDGFLNEV